MRVLFFRSLVIVAIAAAVAEGADTPTSDFAAPGAVVRLANGYVASVQQQEDGARENDIRRSFLRAFFWGFVNPKGTLSGGTPADHAGYQAGQLYWRTNAAKLKETMEGFGYTATNAQGDWSVGFERSVFRAGGDSGRGWWLRPLPSPESSQATDPDLPESGGPVRIAGFLSAKGRYGHLGMCEYQFFATNISLIEIGQPDRPANGSQPIRSETNRTSSAAGSRR
jgi:hypothetical protein